MKDLKHLLYFENLLQEAHNDLIAQAQNEGKICVAYACENTPEPLLNLPGAFSTRLRAPRTGSMEMATYYMTSFLCEYSRALLERAIEGGYNFADCMITPDGCSMMNRAVENMELLKTMGKDKPKFFFEYMEIPMKADDNGLNLYVLQCRNHILTPLHDVYGIDVSDEAIRKSVAEHNRVCELIRTIGEYRKGTNPRITGYEFHVITLATYVAPKYLLIDKLEETLKELKDDTKAKITAEREQSAKIAFENALLEKVAGDIKADIPEVMIEEQCRRFLDEFKQRLQAQGIPYDQYCKMTGMDEAKFMEDGREPAVRQVKMDLAIAAIIKAENLDVTDEEIEEKYKSMAEQYGMELDMLKKYLDAPTVRNQLLNEKAIAVVVDSAKAEKPAKAEKTEGEEEKKPAKKTAKKAAEGEEEKKPAAKKTTKKAAEGEEEKKPAKKTAKKAAEKAE